MPPRIGLKVKFYIENSKSHIELSRIKWDLVYNNILNLHRYTMTPSDTLRKRLLYQSQHRGMREMDLMLGGFAQGYIETMSPQELEQFEALLAFPDQHLYGWFFERAPLPESAPRIIVKAILTFIESR